MDVQLVPATEDEGKTVSLSFLCCPCCCFLFVVAQEEAR
jgi:hypothetical protein